MAFNFDKYISLYVWKVTNCWQNCLNIPIYDHDQHSYVCKIYLSKLHAIVYIDTDLDPDLDTTHGSRSSAIPKIVWRSTPLPINIQTCF